MKFLVSVYRRSGQFLVCTNSVAEAGFWVYDGVRIVPGSADDIELGIAILHAKVSTRREVSDPPRKGPSAFDEVVKLSGAKTYAAFVKSAVAVQVHFDGDSVSVAAMRRDGGGWSELKERRLVLDSKTEASIGNAVKRMMDPTDANGRG